MKSKLFVKLSLLLMSIFATLPLWADYGTPSGGYYANNYLTSITSSGADTNINYSASSHPGSTYVHLSGGIRVEAGSTFTITFTANSLGAGSNTTVREDIRYCHASLFTDFNLTGTFGSAAQTWGNKPPTNNVYGNYDKVMTITATIAVPENAPAGTSRIRMIYTNAWKDWPTATTTGLDKGIAYDIDVEVTTSMPSANIIYNYTFDGSTVASETLTATVGQTMPQPTITIPSYISATYPTLPETVPEGGGTYTIATTTKADSPFKFSTSLANAQWTTMKLLFSKKNYNNGEAKPYNEGTWIAGSGVATILSYTDATETNYDQYIWAFVGDWYNGYKVYSYTDQNKKLVYTGNFTTNYDSNRTITLSDDATLADNQCTWIVVDWTGTNGAEYSEPTYSLRLNNSAHPNYYAGDHISSRVLGTWESTTGNQVNHGRIAFADPAPLYQPFAQSILDNQGVGYPAADSDVRNALSTAISGAATFNDLKSKVDAFMNESAQIELPTDGKAYRIKAKYNTGDVRWLKFTENASATDDDLRLTLGLTDVNTVPTGYEGTFICHKVNDNEYIFTTNKGKFLTWCGDGKQNVTGKQSSFASEYTYGTHNATLKLANTAIKSHASASDLFGALTLQGWNNTDGADFYLMAGETNFHNSGASDVYYTNNRSSAFYFEETDYPNVVTLTQATGIDDGTKKIATFSAPFAFTVPEGVNAYVVETVPTSSTAQMAQLATAGSTVAANTGVILYGATAETQVRMIPATETGASNASSLLCQSAGEAKQIVDVTGQTNYILVNKDGNIVFSKALANGENKNISMNKAYLSIPAGSPVNQFALSFGDEGETTGINAIEAGQAGSTAAPVYDLSGRRISQPATRGIYIRGGKKFMVK